MKNDHSLKKNFSIQPYETFDDDEKDYVDRNRVLILSYIVIVKDHP